MLLVDQTQPVECLRQPHFVCGLIKLASLLNIIHSNDRFSLSLASHSICTCKFAGVHYCDLQVC